MDKIELFWLIGFFGGMFLLLLTIWCCSQLPDKIKYHRRQKYKDNEWLKRYLDILERLQSASHKYHTYQDMYKARIEYLHEHVLFDTPQNLEPIQAQVRELETMLAEAESKYKACCDEMDAHTTDETHHFRKEYLYFF